ncbi:metallophosphoesterase [Loktanella sp. DJP18]|uniref:metallophosphoesterase n=1 Tax=Loktanella sp. DJP18 TaxID=3409788 RepID=UPI003BB6EA60
MLYAERLAITGPKLDNFAFPDNIALLVIGDVHGQNAALRGVLTGLGRVSTPGKPRVLVFLGNLIDRGPDSLGCLNTAFNDAASRARADEVVYLPGNHELLLADTFLEARAGEAAMKHPRAAGGIWAMNGGYAFMSDTYEEVWNQG